MSDPEQNLYKIEHLNSEKRVRLLAKLYEYINQEKLNPNLVNFLTDFISTYELHFNEKPIEEERVEKRERLIVETTKLPILVVGFYELLELQSEDLIKESTEKVQDEEILKVLVILSSLLNINEINLQEIKRRALAFFENRKQIEIFSKDPDFAKHIIKCLLEDIPKLHAIKNENKNISQNEFNEEDINTILNSCEFTNESIAGPLFCISSKYNLLDGFAEAIKTSYEYKGRNIKIIVYPELSTETTTKEQIRGKKIKLQHEIMHIINDFIQKREKINKNELQIISNEDFLKQMIARSNYKIVDEIAAHLSEFVDDIKGMSAFEINDAIKNMYLASLNSYSINQLKDGYLKPHENFIKNSFSFFENQEQLDELVRKNTELMTLLVEEIFNLMKKYYRHIDLIRFTTGISDEKTIHKNIKRLEIFLEKYSAQSKN